MRQRKDAFFRDFTPVAGIALLFFFCRYKRVQCARITCKTAGSAAWPGFYVLIGARSRDNSTVVTSSVEIPAVTLRTFDAVIMAVDATQVSKREQVR